MGAWFTEYYARTSRMPKLREHLEVLFGEDTQAPEDQAEKDAAAARAWNRQLEAIWKAQEAARAAAGA